MWMLIVITAAFFALLYAFCMRVRVGSGAFCAMKRSVMAVWGIVFLSLLPGIRIGLNALNVMMVALLGAPGAVLLQVIALMP